MEKTAKLLNQGRYQVVLLPVPYRFDANEVFIRKDPKSGDVILSRKPNNWDAFLAVQKTANIPDNFLDSAERIQSIQTRDPF